ncbi:MAG: multidrug effflux MFS transporter [Sulfuricaulis sp.]|nr:multidrug effflux MFS transporter [Sulfuricaulis sp.]
MHESAHHAHRHLGLRFTFTVALLAMLAPFSIDTYLPSFPDIGREFAVSAVALQQTLSLYLLAFATMMLVYGPLSDAYGRKNVVLVSTAVYVASSIGCALAPNIHWLLLMRIGQGLSASGALVVGRAIIRDAFAGAAAQRVMSQVMLIFALAPAVAPVIGGWLHDAFGWRSVFWFLVLLGLAVWLWTAFFLPETLPPVGRQSGKPRVIATAYLKALGTLRFMILIAILACNFGGFFLYIAGSPDVMYRHLHYGANEFWRLFVPLVAGLMLGAFISGRIAGRFSHRQAVTAGFGIMLAAAVANLGLALWIPHTAWTIILPVVVYATGMSLATPNLSLLALEVFPAHLGLASALQGFGQAGFNAVVAGLLAPLLSSQVQFLASGMLMLNLTGFVLWMVWRSRRDVRESVPALA